MSWDWKKSQQRHRFICTVKEMKTYPVRSEEGLGLAKQKAAVLKKADELLAAQKWEEALTVLEEVKDIRPVTLDVQNRKARALLELERYAEAMKAYEGFVQSDYTGPEELECHAIRARYHEKRKNPYWQGYHLQAVARLRQQLGQATEPDKARIEKGDDAAQAAMQKALSEPQSNEVLMALMKSLTQTQHHTAATVVYILAAELLADKPYYDNPWFNTIKDWMNHALICQMLLREPHYPVILVQKDEADTALCAPLAKLLAAHGRQVFLLRPPIRQELEAGVIDEAAYVQVVFDNIGLEDGVFTLQPVILSYEGESWDSIPAILFALKESLEGKFALFIAEQGQMLDLFEDEHLQREGQKVSCNFYGRLMDDTAGFGYLGDYCEYVGHIHGFNVRRSIQRRSRVGISVIIPTRNSANTLQYTLRSCLEQRIKNYEVLVCDNSDDGNDDTRRLVEELNDDHLRYIRSPRPLSLTKNFEHAYLQARGEFLFSIGSDDALPFHSLEYLESVLPSLPNDDVIQWERALYFWPDLIASGQNGQFSLDRTYTSHVKVDRYAGLSMLKEALARPVMLYYTPLLYINSGMRRGYFEKLLEKTGRLWNGPSQDIYMGVANLAINESIPIIRAPLAIAGMCGKSQGVRYQGGADTAGEVQFRNREFQSTNVGIEIRGNAEEKFISIGIDAANLYNSFLRVMATGCNPALNEDFFDWTAAYRHCSKGTLKDDLKFDFYQKQLLYSAGRVGPAFEKWFRTDVLPEVYQLAPARSRAAPPEKRFRVGFDDKGGLILDSEQFGVTNVYEACQLMEKLYNL